MNQVFDRISSQVFFSSAKSVCFDYLKITWVPPLSIFNKHVLKDHTRIQNSRTNIAMLLGQFTQESPHQKLHEPLLSICALHYVSQREGMVVYHQVLRFRGTLRRRQQRETKQQQRLVINRVASVLVKKKPQLLIIYLPLHTFSTSTIN